MIEIKCPSNSQLLFYPMMNGTISAGFKNKKYQTAYKYIHYGIDCDSRYGEDFNVIASGSGTVIGIEQNKFNSLGCIVVIQYNNVYNPTTKKLMNCVVRYYHMASLNVKKGDKVNAYDIIGRVIDHKWWNHIHFELDTDVQHPFYTPQVAESSSCLLVRKGATDSTILNPIDVLVVGRRQIMMVHNLAIYADKVQDAPKFSEGIGQSEPVKKNDSNAIKVEVPQVEAALKPILPLNDCKITCGYKNAYYKSIYKLTHYGCDFTSVAGRREIYASANGEIIAAGYDGINNEQNLHNSQSGCGYIIVIKYTNIYLKPKKSSGDAIFSYFHLREKPLVQKGDKVKQGQILGYYGGTGVYVDGDHLHLQIDYDIQYPLYCMGMSSQGHSILKHGTTDSTVDPMEILYIGANQSIIGGKYTQQYDAASIKKLEKA